MSAKLSTTVPSPSITNLANKVIHRLANSNSNSNGSSGNSSNTNTNNASSTLTNSHGSIDAEDDSGENEEDDEDAGIIRCICGFTDDDGYTIQCERCFVWQHAVCVGIDESNVPDKYLCELCSPRTVDRKRAAEIQRRRNGALERKREKSPSRKKSSVGRPRKQFGSTGSGPTEQAIPLTSKENGVHQGAGTAGSANGYQIKGPSSSTHVDANGKKAKTGTKQVPQQSISHNHTASTSTSQSHHSTSKHRATAPANPPRVSSATNDDDDLDMESDSQEDVQDAYQVEFSSIETNIVTSKAVQDLFRQIISQFRQAQSRKRSLSLTSGVRLQELVASNAPAGTSSSTPSIPEIPDPSPTPLGSQPPPSFPSLTADPSNVVSMERESLARPLMKTTVKHILPSKSSHSPAPQYGLFAESNIGAGRFMMEFKGEVTLKSVYKADPINQYSILATPKPFVLFHPQLDLVVDARRSGNDARFVRRSCVPNTEIKSIVVPGVQDHTVHLGLFAKVPIGKGQEITLDWDWNKDHPALQAVKPLIEKGKDSSARKSLKEIRKAKYLVASTLLAQTDCACDNKETCILHQMLRDGLSEATARDDSSAAAKGNRPKKTNPESLRQRYGSGGPRDRPEGKRSAEQETSDEELSIGETSPRRKSPKAPKLENSSKKARHDTHPYQRSVRTDQDMDSDSGSDDDRRRKQTLSERQSSPSKRPSIVSQEMSAREMKQALLLIKKMEDRDASSPGHAKQKSQDLSAKDGGASQKRAGITSPKARSRDKNRSTDQKPPPPNSKKENMAEDDDISIGDSGIDSDSNNGAVRKDPFSPDRAASSSNRRSQAIQPQDAKRDRGRAEHDAVSQSPVTSDSERKDSANRHSRQSSLAQASKKQPYAAASRGKRMGEHSNAKTNPKDRTSQRTRDAPDDAQHMSGSSSVEGSFVSIVGNSSDDDDESSHKASEKVLREKSSKGTLPATTLPSKQTTLPCKKVWKMIYLKQRALAEEEAREKAEEMRKKAEEVFDLKMEEEDSVMDPIESSTMVDTPAVALPSFKDDTDPKAETEPEAAPSCEEKEPSEDTVMDNQPSMVEGDVLNLFREDVQPETCSAATSRNASNNHGDEVDEEKPVSTQPPPVHQPVVVLPQSQDRSSATETAVQDRPRTPQKLSLQSYHARRLASSAVVASDGVTPVPATAIDTSTTQVKDVEMSEPNPIATTSSAADRATEEATTSVGGPQEQKAEPAPAAPKVKLSLLEYQKQRQGASQRSTAPTNAEPSSEASKPIDPNPDTTKQDDSSSAPEAKRHQDTDPVDVEMTERPQETTTTAEGEDQGARDDYFQVGTSLPTPLIGLSSRAQAAGDYFPVQPFSPISLSAGPTPFSKMNLASPPRPSTLSEPQPQTPTGAAAGAQSPGKSPTNQRAAFNSSPKEPLASHTDTRSSGAKLGSSPPPGWRTPRHQRGPSPPPPSAGAGANFRGNLTLSDHRNLDSRSAEGRLASPRYYGSPTDRPDRSGVGPLTSPPRERQHSLTSGGMPTSPFDAGFANAGNHYGYGEDSPSSFKRPGHMSSPTGPPPGSSGPREYYKSDERSRHQSMNRDDWGYGMDSPGYGGYRGPRGAPPPPPRDRERDRDRIRERDHERDRERERRDRFERRGDYFASGLPGGGVLGASGNNGNGLYGPSRGSGGPGGPGGMGGYGRRPSDYYGNQVREEGYGSGKKDGPPDPSLPY